VTVLITEPALDARSLRVAAFRQQGGRAVPVADTENRQIENAILTRARELRIAERALRGGSAAARCCIMSRCGG
jgi:hypothetical protein